MVGGRWVSWSVGWWSVVLIKAVTEILCNFRLVVEEKTCKEIPKSFTLEFSEKFLASNFALDNTSRPLNRGGIADLLLLRTLLTVPQKSRESSFWEVMDPFVLLTYAILAAWITLLLLACLNFTLDSEDYFTLYSVGRNKRGDFYKLWQQRKQLKTMEMNEAWPDTYVEVYIKHF